MKKKTTTPVLSEQYQLPIHAAISESIKKRGQLPQYIVYDDMFNYIIGELEAIRSISGETYDEFFADFLIEIQQMLDTKFYGVKRNSSLSKDNGRKKEKHDASLQLTSRQEIIFEENMRLVDATINRIVDCTKLDAIISRDDLKQCGLIALNYAVQECVEGKNFQAYAIMKIRHAIYNAIAATDQQKNGYVSSLDAILDTEVETPSKVPTSFISESVEDAYERSSINMVELLYTEAHRYLPDSCYRKGIIAIAEHEGNGRSWDELSALFGEPKEKISAWVGKAKPLLYKNAHIREAVNMRAFDPNTDEVPKKKRNYSDSSKRQNRVS